MAGDKKIQHVSQEVLTFVAFKLGIIKELTAAVKISSVSSELIENLRMIVWIERYFALEDSKEFMWNHFARMTASPQLYTTYVIYACHLATKCFADPYEKFVRTLTLVIQMAIYSMPKRVPELLGWTLTIFTNFFEKELSRSFYDRGGWKKFNKYLLLKNSLMMYSEVQQLETQGIRSDDMVKLLNIKATDLKECLNKNAKESSEIENDGPTLSIWYVVETTGFSAGSQFVNQLLKSQSTSDNERTLQENIGSLKDPRNIADGQGSEINKEESYRNFLKPGHVQPVIKSGFTKKIAYLEAKESLKDLQADCQEIEHLLDFIFGDTQEGCQKNE